MLSLPADEAPMFVPVVTVLHHDGMTAAASAQGATAITIEIGGAVVRAAPGVDPAWLRRTRRRHERAATSAASIAVRFLPICRASM